ncbi:MAG: hypothetical protein QOF77_2323 [Solirubrobacteraceae bacterium]|jgi:hypothetical protein|nr:hypothetical protein [Solirubrobacteraceae bacterium]
MEPVNATRTGRSILAATVTATVTLTVTLTLALAIAAGAVDPAGSVAAGRPPRARAADACSGSASLGVSDRRPRQGRPVRFSAADSTVAPASVVFYDYSYGDGSDDATALPTAVHAYQAAGAYAAKLSIVTACNTIVSSSEVRVVVADGTPPTVTIAFPRANQTAHFGSAGLLLRGSARDPAGVRRVELAIQLVGGLKRSARRSAAAHPAAARTTPGCYWYDGRRTLKVRGCARPLFFPVHVRAGQWSFRMNPRSQIPPGTYTARVRATDRSGNITTVFSPKLGNILAFGLVA